MKLKERMEEWCHLHRVAVKRLHGGVHLSYFALVMSHGPYHWPAAILFVIGLVAMMLHLEWLE